jgi:hypothetical protein
MLNENIPKMLSQQLDLELIPVKIIIENIENIATNSRDNIVIILSEVETF